MSLTPIDETWIRELLEEELDREYLVELSLLQVELLTLQEHLIAEGRRLAILFEGRDTAGKGGAIQRFAQHLRPRHVRTVALPKPTDVERRQWYFERYLKHLPTPGEIVCFDRSWYNRAVVEPVMGFCTPEQYELFMQQVVDVERMLVEDGLVLVKLWFSIDQDEQQERIGRRKDNPLKRWKLSSVDLEAQQRWQDYTFRKEAMFARTSTDRAPWTVVEGNEKKRARLECIRHVLTTIDYPGRGRTGVRTTPDPELVARAPA